MDGRSRLSAGGLDVKAGVRKHLVAAGTPGCWMGGQALSRSHHHHCPNLYPPLPLKSSVGEADSRTGE